MVPVADALEMLDLTYDNLVFDDEDDGLASRKALMAALEWLVRADGQPDRDRRVWMIVAEDRAVKRLREEGRFSNSPDTKQQRDLAESVGEAVPVLSLLRQRGTVDDGWRGLPFWWPVVMVPRKAVTSVYSAN